MKGGMVMNNANTPSSKVTLNDITLAEYTLDKLPLLKKLRKGLLAEKPEVCIERARHYTKSLKNAPAGESAELRYANAAKYFLSRKAPLFFDDNLLAGTTGSKPFCAPVYPEWTGLTIWPELDTISDRKKNPLKLSRKDAKELNFEIYPYWMKRNILEYTRKKHNNPRCMRIFERIVFFLATKAGCISHTIPCYTLAMDKGVEHIIAEAASREQEITDENNLDPEKQHKIEFYQAIQKAMQGVIAYARNLSVEALRLADKEPDASRKENYHNMAEVCSRVPAKPARTFREALNTIWLVQVAIHAENINMAMSPGRLDQILYKYYRQDIDNGVLSVRDAMELVGSLWLKLNDNTNLVPETAEELFGGAGTVPAVTVGGVDENGEDAVNDLTYIMLRVTELLKTRDPSLNARFHYKKNSKEYRDRVAAVIVHTKSAPAFLNDVTNIEVLKEQNTTTEHARDYAVIGCVELGVPGRSYDASSAIMLNLVSVLELTLNNGKRPVTGDEQIGPTTGDPSHFESFEQFWGAFKSQFAWLAGKAIELNEYFGRAYQEILPSPLLSAFFEGPMEAGKDLIFGGARYNSSGATHIGFADTVDSLNAIKQAVFVDKTCSFAELKKALDKNFKGYEKLHAYLIHKTPKFGRDDKIAEENSQKLLRFLYDFYQRHVNYRGGRYRPGYWTMTNHAGQGKLAGALPNGRKANQVFASGITPVSQSARDLTTSLRMIGGLESKYIASGEALNLKFPSVPTGQDISRLGQIVQAYCEYGGLHVQFNIMSYEDLIKAKNAPDDYPELLVRVSGYSAYFNDLNEVMKDEIITRTAYDIKTGHAVSFPKANKDMLSYE
jgi:pyruvate formate-lyase/glycerol dehydratase family glycyl radical enzyme